MDSTAATPDERPKVEVFGHQVLIATRLARFDGEAIVTDLMTIFMPLTFITGHCGMNFDTDSP